MVGAWAALTLIMAAATYHGRLARGSSIEWATALQSAALSNAVFVLMAVAAFSLTRHLPLQRGRWFGVAMIHVAAAAAVVLARTLLYYVLGFWLEWLPVASLTTLVRGAGPATLFMYAHLVALGYAFVYHRRARERWLDGARLEARLASAQLQALRGQLQPQFLFSILRSIARTMQSDVRSADRLIARLGDMLRMILSIQEREEVTLREEVELLECYLEIERERYGEGLRIHCRVEPEALDVLVPPFLLQPLVHEAVRRYREEEREAEIRIDVWVRGDALRLEFRGTSSLDSEEQGSDIGLEESLTAVHDRLAGLYDGRHRVEVEEDPAGTRLVKVVIPVADNEPEPVPAGVH